MFGLFRTGLNYEKIFSSQDETRRFLYADSSKTSSILGDEAFINAWLGSKNVGNVNAVIKSEAMRGDVPSLKQMIWLSNVYYEDAPNKFKNPDQLLEARTVYLQERIKYCQNAIEFGLTDQSYYAMTSSAKLYDMYQHIPNSMNNPVVQMAVLGVVAFAEMFLESGTRERELIQDAKDAIAYYTPMANIVAQMVER